jgi:hypothetical protein
LRQLPRTQNILKTVLRRVPFGRRFVDEPFPRGTAPRIGATQKGR